MARITKNNIEELQHKLLNWFKVNGRDFPWRDKGLTPYQVVIAETLLQRTKAETVSSFYTKFISAFPDWIDLFNAETESISNYLRPIGLYSQRANLLKKLAAEMVARNGNLPTDRKELESIPFLGQYIANAVELIVFKQAKPLLDVNMARVLERYFGSRQLADIRYDPYLQNLAHKVIDIPDSVNLNWAILDFAALVCKALRPLCHQCILRQKCTYFKSNK